MKTKLLLSVLLSFVFYLLSSQVPQGFNYQAVARDPDNAVLANKDLQVRITLQTTIIGGTKIWEETHPVTTNEFGLMAFVIGTGTWTGGSATLFSDINWSLQPLFLKTEVDPGTGYVVMGTSQLWAVPYSMVAKDLDGPVEKLGVTGVTANMDEALFEVKNRTGQTVFAVYNEGVRVYVDNGAKGIKGGFAIGGFDKTKDGINQDYFIVNRDSVRVYLDTLSAKTRKGGFAIGGFNRLKGVGDEEYLRVTRDSTRIYINDLAAKTRKGGFAIGGFNQTKAGNKSFLNVATDESGIINPSQNRILWYPLKNAFLTGKVLIEKPDSVGINSFASGFESKAKGGWSQALGYQSIARGNYSTAIGKYAVSNSPGSFAFGNSAQALNESSFAFGTGATATGINSYAFGSIGIDTLGVPTGQRTISSGNNSIAIGMGSQSTNLGAFSFGIGNIASGEFSLALGYESKSPAHYGVAIGRWATAYEVYSVAIGDSSLVTGHSSLAIGKNVKALGRGCLTLGNYSESWGYSSIAIGTNAKSKAWAISIGGFTSATGFWSTAIGYKTTATGLYSNAFGRESVASGENSLSFGRETLASGLNSFASGYQSKAAGNYSFSFGYRAESNNFSAISLGNYAIAGGYSSYSLGYNTKASGGYSTAFGYSTTASGIYSMSSGYSSVASGGYAVAMGDRTISSGNSTTALGSVTTATGQATTSLGSNTYASGFHSVSMGLNTTSQSFCSLVLGRYNTISGTTFSWIDTEPLFVIGNGTSTAAPSNAFTVLKNGNVGILTSTPITKLDITGGNWDIVNGEGDLRIGNGSYRFKLGVATGGSGSGDVRLNAVGGTSRLILGGAGNDILVVNNTNVAPYTNNATSFGNATYRWTTIYATNGIINTSDKRLKTNIGDINYGLESIIKMRPVSFTWRDDSENIPKLGLLAQDLQNIISEVVDKGDDPAQTLGINYTELIPVLIKGIQEQQQQINSQQKEINELKSLINSLITNQTAQINK